MELEQYRKQVTTPIINTLPFENILSCSHASEEELHKMKSKFYTKVVDFMDLLMHPKNSITIETMGH